MVSLFVDLQWLRAVVLAIPTNPGDCHCSQWQGQRNWRCFLKFQVVFEKATRDERRVQRPLYITWTTWRELSVHMSTIRIDSEEQRSAKCLGNQNPFPAKEWWGGPSWGEPRPQSKMGTSILWSYSGRSIEHAPGGASNGQVCISNSSEAGPERQKEMKLKLSYWLFGSAKKVWPRPCRKPATIYGFGGWCRILLMVQESGWPPIMYETRNPANDVIFTISTGAGFLPTAIPILYLAWIRFFLGISCKNWVAIRQRWRFYICRLQSMTRWMILFWLCQSLTLKFWGDDEYLVVSNSYLASLILNKNLGFQPAVTSSKISVEHFTCHPLSFVNPRSFRSQTADGADKPAPSTSWYDVLGFVFFVIFLLCTLVSHHHTIWVNMFFTFSKHQTSKSKCCYGIFQFFLMVAGIIYLKSKLVPDFFFSQPFDRFVWRNDMTLPSKVKLKEGQGKWFFPDTPGK